MTSDSRRDLERYLAQTRAGLRGLPEGEIDDILRELRSHIMESTSEGTTIGEGLRALGSPVDLAKTYGAENQMLQAECAGSTLAILQGLQHAGKSRLSRLFAAVLYVWGYVYVVTLFAAAILKVLSPAHTGFWYTPGNLTSFHLIVNGAGPSGARELLGWWLVPVAVVAGWALRYIIDQLAQWWIRRYRVSISPQLRESEFVA